MSEEATSPSPSPTATSILSRGYPADVAQAFEQWMKEYELVYSGDEEKERRFSNFKKSFNFVENFMKGPKQSFTVGLNLFSDMDEDEKRAFHCTVPILHNPPPIPSNKRIKKRITFLDDFSRICGGGIDWSESFASIKRIRGQGLTFAVEGLHALIFQLQNPPMLSVQQLIDCNVANHGCEGGNVLDAFTYIISNEGLNTEQNYPYHGIQRTCDTVKEKGDGLEIDAYTS
ncbi:zingipain-2-like [Prunus yedoensis var. nudiflora]|uniref:Zingipain-2-like n=1 Tax=Prunus yedoensis var. nudiflora TaxID=2094558 RepID=A0A314XUJ5_PRUYE|nr:zingipain-2-like [Prunus yedoensis var. nudiflora]